MDPISRSHLRISAVVSPSAVSACAAAKIEVSGNEFIAYSISSYIYVCFFQADQRVVLVAESMCTQRLV